MQLVVKHCKITATVVDRLNPKLVAIAGSDGHLREVIAGDETKSLGPWCTAHCPRPHQV